MRIQPCPFIYIPSADDFVFQLQSLAIETETTWPRWSKTFPFLTFAGKKFLTPRIERYNKNYLVEFGITALIWAKKPTVLLAMVSTQSDQMTAQ